MRAGLQLALEHQSLEAAGLLEEEPFRRGQRREILDVTIAPLRNKLGPKAYQRLMKALAVVYGIEPMIVLKDICGASDRETEAVVRWMMDALVDAALREGIRKSDSIPSAAPASRAVRPSRVPAQPSQPRNARHDVWRRVACRFLA